MFTLAKYHSITKSRYELPTVKYITFFSYWIIKTQDSEFKNNVDHK